MVIQRSIVARVATALLLLLFSSPLLVHSSTFSSNNPGISMSSSTVSAQQQPSTWPPSMPLMRKRVPRSLAGKARDPPASSSTSSSASFVSKMARGGFCALPFCRTCPPPSMYCGAVSSSSSSSSSFDGGDSDTEVSSVSDSASLGSNGVETQAQQQLQVRAGATGRLSQWKENLLKASNFASLLCVLDCTILPIVTIVFPLFGIVAASPAQMEWLHELGHSVALFFVMPVGGLATFMNYAYAHRTKWIAALGVLGLTLVLGANAGCSLVGHDAAIFGSAAFGHWLHETLHWMHHGIQHRLANLTGCALLLFSNWLSHKRQHAAGTCSHGPGCTHDHH